MAKAKKKEGEAGRVFFVSFIPPTSPPPPQKKKKKNKLTRCSCQKMAKAKKRKKVLDSQMRQAGFFFF